MSDVRVNWFEIPVPDPTAAAGFYGKVLGAAAMGEMPGPEGETMSVFMGPEGPSGALIATDQDNPIGNAGAMVYLNCANIDAALKRVTAAGGTVLAPKTPIGPFGFIARFTDPAGNHVALHSQPA